MQRKNGILIRKVTAADSEALAKFMLENLPRVSPICQALQFEKADYEAMYVPRIAESLPSGISVLAIDEATNEIVGYHLVSLFYRDPSKNPPVKPKKTAKAQILAGLSQSLRDKFWNMVPPEVNCVVRGETSCVKKEYQRRGIAESFIAEMSRAEDALVNGVDGGLTATTSYSNQKLCEKIGFLDLAEVSYKDFFERHGIPYEGAFTDGTTKVILQFRPNSEEVRQKILRSKL